MKYTEIDILNYVDGRLGDEQTAEFLAELRVDQELATLVKAMQASHQPIKQAYQHKEKTPVPDALRNHLNTLVTQTSATQANHTALRPGKKLNTFGSVGLVASLICGVVIGALFMQFYQQRGSSAQEKLAANTAITHERLVTRIADYQSLYVENTVADLSATRSEDAQTLLAALSINSRVNTAIPDFTSFGYEFARAQELGFEGATLVQLVYQKPGSAPLAFCYMPGALTPTLALNISQHHELKAASWVMDNQHYVLLADESNDTLEQMYRTASVLF